MTKKRFGFLLVVAAAGLCAIWPPGVLAQTTDLRVTKSGGDVVMTWTGGSPNFTVAKSNNDPRFSFPQTLAADFPSSPYTYSGAVSNGQTMEFIVVVGNGESNPAGNYTGGAIPPPIPIVSSVSPTSGLKVGDPLTINGSGFSATLKDNVVHFPEGITATPSAATASQLTVTIPRGALSGPAWVQVGNQVSGSTQLVILTQAGFQNLSGVDYQPITHDIWLADRGWGSSYYTRIEQLTFSGTTWSKHVGAWDTATSGSWKYQGGQGFDSGQNGYYGVAYQAAGGGTRRILTQSPYTYGAFTRIKSGSDAIYVIGAATSPSLTDTAFFAYNDSTIGEKHICELKVGGVVLDPDYGNFGATNLNFNTLAGLALDQNGNLFDTETTQVRKITPSETSSVVITGFSGAMGIAVDQVNTSDPGELLVSDSSANTLYGVDLFLPQKQTVISGLAGHRAASFAVTPLNTATCASLPNTDLAFVLADETTQVRQVPDPRITLLPSAPTRVWISKARADDQYPSPYQNADHHITITAEGGPGRRICFRIVDPPALAPYADGTTTGRWCDNRDPSSLAGVFVENGLTVYCTTANDHGIATATLDTTNRYAGDNYIVQASYDTWDANGGNTTKALAQTGVITAWKRIYIEKDMMFRQGGILAANANAGDNKVIVWNWANLPACGSTPNVPPCYQIAIIDSQHPYEGNHDEPYVSYVVPDPNITGASDLYLVDATGNNPYALTYSYVSSPYPAFNSGNSAGVGVIGSGFYVANLGDMWQAYNDAFVEFWVPPDGCGAIPYLPPSFFDGFNAGTGCTTGTQKGDLSAWFRFAWIWYLHHTQQNYFWVGGVGTTAPLDAVNCTVCTSNPTPAPQILGLTMNGPFTTESFVFAGAIEAYCKTPDQTINAVRGTTNHEIGHDFMVNPPQSSGGHDDRCQWLSDGGATCTDTSYPICNATDDPNTCLMSPGRERWTTKHRFDRWDLLCGWPVSCSGSSPPGCCATCALPGDGAIRDFADLFQGVSP